jgi:hypothetical protein
VRLKQIPLSQLSHSLIQSPVCRSTVHQAQVRWSSSRRVLRKFFAPFCFITTTWTSACMFPAVLFALTHHNVFSLSISPLAQCPEPQTWGFTLDDGPNCSHNAFYDFLQQHNQKASLFYIGSNVVDWPYEAQRGLADGHEMLVLSSISLFCCHFVLIADCLDRIKAARTPGHTHT